ncbi:LOW QUALITY PROTEIN: hypothetical protein TorRG33x02_020610 [Trema orientale]|uniref:Transmembrane protein n=1 Tax=Trema orientale TaxID=63057 RepID=A0A2P5FWZ0_TREOI|nr:LOW QUALITY PROTEIN: hypothetical protein TorRG33x02_020610 [Trema orientale]
MLLLKLLVELLLLLLLVITILPSTLWLAVVVIATTLLRFVVVVSTFAIINLHVLELISEMVLVLVVVLVRLWSTPKLCMLTRFGLLDNNGGVSSTRDGHFPLVCVYVDGENA